MKSKSQHILKSYKAIYYWYEGYKNSMWYRSQKVLTTPEQRHVLHECHELITQAQKKLRLAFEPEMGQAALKEVEDE